MNKIYDLKYLNSCSGQPVVIYSVDTNNVLFIVIIIVSCVIVVGAVVVVVDIASLVVVFIVVAVIVFAPHSFLPSMYFSLLYRWFISFFLGHVVQCYCTVFGPARL